MEQSYTLPIRIHNGAIPGNVKPMDGKTKGMGLLSNSKVMLGTALALLILSAPLSVMSTGAVEDAVEENFETFPTDTACANDDCTEAEEDWATDTGARSYYAWNLTNPGDETPVYEQVGPFDYDITYTREIIDFNKSAGTLTYSESKVYTCAEDTATPCDTEVTTTNIPFQPQVVGCLLYTSPSPRDS